MADFTQYREPAVKGWQAAKQGVGRVAQSGGGLGKLLPFGISVGVDLASAKSLGLSPIESVGRGLAIWAGYGVLGTGPMLALTMGYPLARAAATALPVAYRAKQAQWNQYHKPNLGGRYADTQAALTMRQSAIQAIQGSHMNARSALGGEAALFARSLQQVRVPY